MLKTSTINDCINPVIQTIRPDQENFLFLIPSCINFSKYFGQDEHHLGSMSELLFAFLLTIFYLEQSSLHALDALPKLQGRQHLPKKLTFLVLVLFLFLSTHVHAFLM